MNNKTTLHVPLSTIANLADLDSQTAAEIIGFAVLASTNVSTSESPEFARFSATASAAEFAIFRIVFDAIAETTEFYRAQTRRAKQGAHVRNPRQVIRHELHGEGTMRRSDTDPNQYTIIF